MEKISNFTTNIEKERKDFMLLQRKRLDQLKEMQKAKKRGEEVDISSVISELQNSGILDKNGNLKKIYK